jgi:deoxycytidine triphosphate deaminase
MPAFEDVVPAVGFLTDRRIREALDADYLLERGTWDADSIRHASYMLRLGERIHVRPAKDTEFGLVSIGDQRRIWRLEPGATALLYSLERLRFPRSVLGFTVARGLLFSQPLVPENTYVDPGFSGELYTVVTNITGRAVELEYKMAIARLFFYRLEEPVVDPYRRGFALEIPQLLVEHEVTDPATSEGASTASFETLARATSQIPIPGSFIHAELFRRQRRRLDYLAAVLLIWPVLLVVAHDNDGLRDALGGSFVTGALTALVIAFLLWGLPQLWKWLRKH